MWEGGGDLIVNLPVVFPGYWVMALLIAQGGTERLVSCTVLCVSFKYSQKKLLKPKSSTIYMLNQRPELHAGMSILENPW